MLVKSANERIRETRLHRRLRSSELAGMANISLAEVSLIERRMRAPKTDTLQRIAAALEVSTSYLLGEEDAPLELPQALSRQSLKIFLREAEVSAGEEAYLMRLRDLTSAPDSVRGWKNLLENLRLFVSAFSSRPG